MPDLFVAHTTTKAVAKTPLNASAVAQTTPEPPSPSRPGLFSMFSHIPEGIRFADQEQDETIILFLRRHFITNLSWIAGTILFLIAPFIVGLFLSAFPFLPFSLPARYTLIFFSFYYLIVFGYLYINFIQWFYNVGIITNKRVVDIDFINILSKSVASTNLSDVVDVDYQQKGFLQSFYDYADVHIQTEGLKANFEFLASPRPAKIADVISRLIGRHGHQI